MKLLDENTLKLSKNIMRLIEKTKDKKVYVYAPDGEGQFIKKFMEIFACTAEVSVVTDLSERCEGVCVVPAYLLNSYAEELAEKKIISNDGAKFLKEVRYSEREWVLEVEDLCTIVLEKGLCSVITQKLKKKTAAETRVAFHIVDHCNLNCQMCNKFAPLADKHFIDTESILKDIEVLGKLTSHTLELINITGGEPTLHPDLEKIIEAMRLQFPNIPIRLMTNGILLKEKPNSFFEFLKNNKITIFLTKYPIAFDYDIVLKKIEENKMDIEYGVSVEEIKTSWKFPFDLEGKQEKFWMLFCWMHGTCLNCVDGKIYPCGLMQASTIFEKYYDCKLHRRAEDYFDLYGAADFDSIAEFMTGYQPFCANCKISDWEIDIPWKRSSKDINEWV